MPAPPSRRSVAVAVALLGIAAAPAQGERPHALPSGIDGLVLGPAQVRSISSGGMAALRRSHVNAVVLDGVGPRGTARMRRLARAQGLLVVAPVNPARGCRTARPCAVWAPTPGAIGRLARRPGVDLVAVRLRTAAAVAGLARPPRGRVLAIVPARHVTALRAALARAHGRAWLDLAAVARTARERTAYLRLLASAARTPVGRGAAPAPPPVAALPPASVFVAPTGSDAAPCTPTAPCLSLDRAYHAALPGHVVEVAAGTYPTQAIRPDPAKTSPDDVVIRPAPGARVTTGELQVYARHLEIRDMTSDGWYAKAGSDDVTFRGITSTGGIFVASASNIAMIGGSVGPGVDYHSQIAAATGSSVSPTNILIDGVTFHDWRRSNSSVHTECLQILNGDGVTIRNSRFTRCDVMDIHVSTFGSAPETRNVTIENNFLDTTGSGGFYAVNSGMFANLLIRNNSSLQPLITDPTRGTGGNIRVYSNVAPMSSAGCQPNVTYGHNVWDGTRCSPTDINAAPGFVDPATLDLHLAPGSAAINRGDPVNSTATDIDGQLRDSRPDAGADER